MTWPKQQVLKGFYIRIYNHLWLNFKIQLKIVYTSAFNRDLIILVIQIFPPLRNYFLKKLYFPKIEVFADLYFHALDLQAFVIFL